MMKTYFRKYPVRNKTLQRVKVENEVRVSMETRIAEHSYKQELKVPKYPAMNREKAFNVIKECGKRKSYHATTIYLFILTQMETKEDCTSLTLVQAEIAELLELSIAAVSKAFSILEELKVLTKIGKSSYKISAEVAFIGDHLSWAEAMYEEQTGTKLITTDTIISQETL